jgi:hypothetical protein
MICKETGSVETTAMASRFSERATISITSPVPIGKRTLIICSVNMLDLDSN